MYSSDNLTSSCRCCQYYTPEGRRGGECQQLHVPVKGGWKSCQLAIPAFAMSWEMKEIIEIQHQPSGLTSLNPSLTSAALEPAEATATEVVV